MAKLTHSTDWGMEAVERAAIERGDIDPPPSNIYRDFVISFDPPPIPLRDCDWQAFHVDYDGPEDGRWFVASSAEEMEDFIDLWHEERS